MENRKVGPIVTTVIIVVLVIIGGIYLFASYANKEDSYGGNGDTSAPQSTVAPVTNNSDEVDTIQADLNASIQGLDQQDF